MQPTTTGKVKSHAVVGASLGDLFFQLFEQEATGELALGFTERARASVYFREGFPEFVHSTVNVDYLGGILRELGLISEMEYNRSMQLLAQGGRRHGEVLIEMGALTHTQLKRGLSVQLRRKISRLFAPKRCSWAWYVGNNPHAPLVHVHPREGILVGLRSHPDLRMLTSVAKRMRQQRLRLPALFDPFVPLYGFDPAEAEAVYSLMDGWCHFDALERRSPLDGTGLRVLLRALEITQVLQLEGAPATANAGLEADDDEPVPAPPPSMTQTGPATPQPHPFQPAAGQPPPQQGSGQFPQYQPPPGQGSGQVPQFQPPPGQPPSGHGSGRYPQFQPPPQQPSSGHGSGRYPQFQPPQQPPSQHGSGAYPAYGDPPGAPPAQGGSGAYPAYPSPPPQQPAPATWGAASAGTPPPGQQAWPGTVPAGYSSDAIPQLDVPVGQPHQSWHPGQQPRQPPGTGPEYDPPSVITDGPQIASSPPISRARERDDSTPAWLESGPAAASQHQVGEEVSSSAMDETWSYRKNVENMYRKVRGEADHFEILGLERTASSAEIQEGYRLLAEQFHPSRVPSTCWDLTHKVEKIFEVGGESYGVLFNETERRAYLRRLEGKGRTVRKMDPQAREAYDAGIELLNRGKAKDALDRLERAHSLDRADFAILGARAWARWSLENAKRNADQVELKRHRVELEKALLNDPTDKLLFWFGEVLLAEGDAEGAKKRFREAVDVNPYHTEAKRRLAQRDDDDDDKGGFRSLFGRKKR